MNNKYLVLGYFGFSTNQLCGQTVKTRNIYDLLKENEKLIGKVSYFDTQEFKSNKFSLIKMFWKILNHNRLVYLPAHNSFTYLFPIIFIISKIKGIKIIHVVVGSWLSDFLIGKRIYIYLLSRIVVNLPQTKKTVDSLKFDYNINNVCQLNNFRINNFTPSFVDIEQSFRIVFMARINKYKGIEYVFSLAEKLIENNINITIDFYGQIFSEDYDYFFKEINRLSNVFYKGQLEPNEIYSNLEKYDVLLLPTFFSDEGFPGSILDAYISGIPVIVSRWKDLPHFVEHEKTGFVFDLDKPDEIYSYVLKLYLNRNLLKEMKKQANIKSKEFSSDIAWLTLSKYLK